MRFFLSIAILLCAAVTLTVSASTRSTIQGPTQGSFSTSALPEDCLSTVDWRDVVFLAAVPIAIGFGLLLLLASVQDLRQARKSTRSRPLAPSTIRGNRARKERTYVIDVDCAGRSRWGSFLRRCVMRKSSRANNPRLVRLQGTIGFSDWMSFDLILGKNSEQKTVTTPRSIGKLVAVETKYLSASREINSMHLPTSNIAACLRGVLNRACDIEIKTIRVTDAKTQETFISGCGPSSAGISISEQGIITILPLLPFTAKPTPRVNYCAYFLKTGSLWTSAFIPWHEGNFTGARHITCLFMCITYTMFAERVISKPFLEPSIEEIVVVSPMGFDINLGLVIRAAGVSAILFPFVIMVEVLGRTAPTIWSIFVRPHTFPTVQQGNSFPRASHSSQPSRVQSTAGDFCGGRCETIEQGLPRKSNSAPEMQQQASAINGEIDDRRANDSSSRGNNISKRCAASRDTPTVCSSFESVKISSDDICGDNQSICPADMLECYHKFACYKCPVCKRTTGSRYYSPGAGCSQVHVPPLIRYNMYGSTELTTLRYAYSSSSLDSEDTDSLNSITTAVNLSKSLSSVSSRDSLSSSDYSKSTSISDSSSDISSQLLDESAPYNIQDVTKTTANDNDNQDHVEKDQTAPSMPSAEGPSQHGPDSISRATSTSGLLYNQQKNISKQEAGDRQRATKYRDKQYLIEQEDNNPGIKLYSAALNDANIHSAKVLHTKNYINKFSDMGKGKAFSLPANLASKSCDAFLPKDKPNDKQLTDNKSSQSAPGSMPELTKDHIKTPTECGPVTTTSDYVIDMAMTFEMPNVTIQSSSSHKSYFFNLRKWLGGLRSKPKPDSGDRYKLDVTENNATIKTSAENSCPSSILKGSVITDATQIEGNSKVKPKHDSSFTRSTTGCADKNLKTISPTKDDGAKTVKAGNHLQGSIFQSSSHLIEYQPQVTKVASSDTWASISSAEDAARAQFTPCVDADARNKNNSNEVTIIEIEPCEEPSSSVPISTNSEALVSVDTSQSSSDSTTLKAESLLSAATSITNDSLVTANDRFSTGEGACKAELTTTSEDSNRCFLPILAGIIHSLLIASCVLTLLWSLSSIHGLCWNAFWEWVATSIIAIIIQAVVLDTLKGIVVTLVKMCGSNKAARPTPHSLIH